MTVSAYLAVLRRRAIVLIACVIAGLIGAAVVVSHTPKEYRSTATLYVALPRTSNILDQNGAFQLTAGFLTSFQRLASTAAVQSAVAAKLGLPAGAVAGQISATVEQSTFFILVSAVDRDPGRARIIADTAADVMSNEIVAIQGKSVDPITAAIVDRAYQPLTPFQPTPSSTLALGFAFSLLIGIALIALLEALDRSARGVDQIAALADTSPLAVVPRRRGSEARRLIVGDELAEPYRALRTAVTFLNPDNPPRVLVVTSPVPGDGKTTTAANLAVAISGTGQSVLLIDADLRRQNLTRALGAERGAGLSSVITRQADPYASIQQSGTVAFLPAGPIAPNPSELLGSQAAAALIADYRDRYDYVVIDAPPALAVTDAVVMAPHADAVILVVRHGETPRAAITAATKQFETVGVHPAGVVVNGIPRSESSGYYGQYVYTQRSARFGRLRRRNA